MTSGPAKIAQLWSAAPGWSNSARWRLTRDLLWELIVRDMKLRYRGSFLGLAWTLLNPIAELLVLMFVFSVVLPLRIPNYAVFLFTGLLVYSWFQQSLLFATGAIVNNRELIKRPGVPSGVLPVVTVASQLLHFLLALPILFALMLLTDVPITTSVAALVPIIAVQFVFTLSLAYPLAALHVWLRDTQYVLRVALQLLFYLTPVFYSLQTVPDVLRQYYAFNPMMQLLTAYRAVLVDSAWPAVHPLVVLAMLSLVLLAIGFRAFKRTSHRFADEL